MENPYKFEFRNLTTTIILTCFVLVSGCNSAKESKLAQDEGGFQGKNEDDHVLGGAAALPFTEQNNSKPVVRVNN